MQYMILRCWKCDFGCKPTGNSLYHGWGAKLYGALLVRKKREIWFLCRQYNAKEALEMGLVNTVVPYADLEKETVRWCR